MAFIDDVTAYIDTNTALTTATNLFIDYLPDSPDYCVMVRNTGGTPPSIDIPTYRPTFQVLVRHTDYATGLATIKNIRDLLHRLYNTTINSGTYVFSITALGEPGHIGRDEAGRDEFSINFQCYHR